MRTPLCDRRENRYALNELRQVKPKDPSQIAEEVRLYLTAKKAKERRPAYRGKLCGQVESRHALGPLRSAQGTASRSEGAL